MRKPDYDVFTKKFSPYLDGEGNIKLYETYGEDLEVVLNTSYINVFTLIEAEDKWYLSPGYHLVNRVNYVITEKSHNKETRDYKYG